MIDRFELQLRVVYLPIKPFILHFYKSSFVESQYSFSIILSSAAQLQLTVILLWIACSLWVENSIFINRLDIFTVHKHTWVNPSVFNNPFINPIVSSKVSRKTKSIGSPNECIRIKNNTKLFNSFSWIQLINSGVGI